MQLLFIMSAYLSLGKWTLRTSPELAGQELQPKLCGWKLHPTWQPAFTIPIATGDHGIVASMIHGGHNYLWNYTTEENGQINTCKRPAESEGMRERGKALSEEELNHFCFSCKYSFYGWTSGFWRSFPASMILWLCELRKYECLPWDGAKS